MLARTLPIGDGPKPIDFGTFVCVAVRHWVMVLIYVALLVVALLIGSIPVALATTLLSLISPVIGSLIFMLLSGTLLVLFFYLYFVTAAVVYGQLTRPPCHLPKFCACAQQLLGDIGLCRALQCHHPRLRLYLGKFDGDDTHRHTLLPS